MKLAVSDIRSLIALLTTVAHLGCGGTEAPAAQAPKPAPAETSGTTATKAKPKCSKAVRNGTYKVQLQGLSSNCDAIADYGEELKDGIATLGKDCDFDKPDKWTDGDCTLERAYTCKETNGTSTRTILVSTQDEPDGSILAGILSIRKLDKSGSESCQGTYRFIASRS
jgi:hypothetical protein